jgi:hypothetical protein
MMNAMEVLSPPFQK